ncbi:MAG: formylmethanofuran dehydrogenase subunit E family protein [Methanomassiliicoccales archaeon]|nr:formylmethanofuran dehydrogenase subunit E family protein [Methanomassiliicoccales archaeon]MDD1755290.1 formylmethanofuran dehydrogenase subunit E family protein [Methanomassiliicoccales archaeon]
MLHCCNVVNLPEELRLLKKFHGHLGPYVVVGYRMGGLARQKLVGRLKAVSFTGTKPPLSCIIDGVQYSSSCTLGKGNITVLEAGDAKVQFLDDKHLVEISLLDKVKEGIDRSMSHDTEELLALTIFNEPEADLFHVTTIERSPIETRVKLK